MSKLNKICPHCDKRIEMNSSIDGSIIQPKDGDAGICIECHGIFKFKNEIRYKANILEFPEEIQFQLNRVIETMIKVKKRHKE